MNDNPFIVLLTEDLTVETVWSYLVYTAPLVIVAIIFAFGYGVVKSIVRNIQEKRDFPGL